MNNIVKQLQVTWSVPVCDITIADITKSHGGGGGVVSLISHVVYQNDDDNDDDDIYKNISYNCISSVI